MDKFLFAFVVGYITSFLGFIPGIVFSKGISKLSKRSNGALIGFTGGLLIAFVCFELLTEALELSSVLVVVVSMLCGVIFCAFFENKSETIAETFRLDSKNKFIRTAIFISIGICMHNIPEGMAVGSLIDISLWSALKMALILCLHHIPEALAVTVPFSKGGLSSGRIILVSLMLSLPMAFGSVIGYATSFFSSTAAVFLGFSGGTMIYICCGEIIPESKSIWKGRLSTIFACFGFIAGVVITSVI